MIIGYLWFVNSIILLVGSLATFIFFLFPPQNVPYKTIKRHIATDISLPKESNDINYDTIVSRDIFNALHVVPKEEAFHHINPPPAIALLPLPRKPNEIQMSESELEEEYLLPPLQISLKGTIISSNPRTNKVFLENNRTKEEKMYGIGDIIEDAQIVLIGKGKTSLIRSNGQQETIFISPSASKNDDINYTYPWNKIITPIENESKIKIDIRLLEKKIQSAADFIDMLDLVTYFRNSIPIGCLVGMQGNNSLGSHLGLDYGDIVTAVDGISVATPASRIKLYEYLTQREYHEAPIPMTITVLRHGKNMTLHYELFKSQSKYNKKSISFLDDVAHNTALPPKQRLEHTNRTLYDQLNHSPQLHNNDAQKVFSQHQRDLVQNGKKNNALFRRY